MPDQDIAITLALVLTAGGAVVGQGIVAAIVQFLKGFPGDPIGDHARLAAAIVSGVLVAVAYVTVTVAATPPIGVSLLGLIGALLAWFNIARGSMALYADFTREPNSLTGPQV